jgi:AP-1 complex subunit gamma-1
MQALFGSGTMRLRDLIKAVRQCKTAAEERDVVAKECAAIRTSIKADDPHARPRNVAKLLYINMLGYPTQFGQMECLKLIVSGSYSDKRIGYLGLMLLLDENQEVLMLVTNSLTQDLRNSNQYIVGLALAAIGNIGSIEIARDCAPLVEQLLSSSNPYIRKKAALSVTRILKKVPELLENFVPRVKALLVDKNHGVLITGVTLMIQMCDMEPKLVPLFREGQIVQQLVRILKSLVQFGYSPEYDVSGITDPFLQVRILKFLRILGTGSADASDTMNDILAQVATNTDNMRNVGNAILYECVNTIMSIDSESALRVLAINILGRFLANRDNNIRYVALNILNKVVNIDSEAVQKHRNTVVECLKDPDISIRKRALELIYALVNESSVKVLVRELLNYLLVADQEFKADLTEKLCFVAEKYAPTKRWHIDTIVRIMSIAGQYVPEEVASNMISIISLTPELQAYAVQKMYLALTKDSTQQALVRVGVWCIGEFGDLLIANTPSGGEDGEESIKVSEEDVVNLMRAVMKNPVTTTLSKKFILTALLKLSSRFSAAQQDPLQKLVSKYQGSINLELQQRSVEYSQLMELNDIKGTILDRMPAPERPEAPVNQPVGETKMRRGGRGDTPVVEHRQPAVSRDPLIDILGLEPTTNLGPNTGKPVSSDTDILGQIFGGSPVNTNPTPGFGMPTGPTPQPLPDMMSLLGLGGPMPTTATPQFPTMPVWSGDGINIVFDFSKSSPQDTLVTATYTNGNPFPVNNFVLQAAVPKYITLALNPASATLLPPNNMSKVTQTMQVQNTQQGQKPLLMKLRLEYSLNGQQKEQMVNVANFPSTM